MEHINIFNQPLVDNQRLSAALAFVMANNWGLRRCRIFFAKTGNPAIILPAWVDVSMSLITVQWHKCCYDNPQHDTTRRQEKCTKRNNRGALLLTGKHYKEDLAFEKTTWAFYWVITWMSYTRRHNIEIYNKYIGDSFKSLENKVSNLFWRPYIHSL